MDSFHMNIELALKILTSYNFDTIVIGENHTDTFKFI